MLSGKAAKITGNKKAEAELTNQLEKEETEHARALMALGNNSDNNTQTVTPDEAAKENANPTSRNNKPYPWYPTRVNIPNSSKKPAIHNDPRSNNLFLPTLSIKDIPIIVATRLVAPIITVCQMAESVENPTERKMSAL